MLNFKTDDDVLEKFYKHYPDADKERLNEIYYAFVKYVRTNLDNHTKEKFSVHKIFDLEKTFNIDDFDKDITLGEKRKLGRRFERFLFGDLVVTTKRGNQTF